MKPALFILIAGIVPCLYFTVPASAETNVITAEGSYIMGDGETPLVAEGRALQRAKQNAAEQVATYVETFTVVRNETLTQDEIKSIAGAVLRIEVLEKRRTLRDDTLHILVRIKATVLSEDLPALVERLRKSKPSYGHSTVPAFVSLSVGEQLRRWSDRERNGLRGRVRSVTEYRRPRDARQRRLGDMEIERIQRFDNEGFETEDEMYYDGAVVGRFTSRREEDGTFVREQHNKDGTRVAQYRTVFSADPIDEVVKEEEYKVSADGKQILRHSLTLDRNGNPLEAISYDKDGNARTKQIFTYDAEGRKTWQKTYYNSKLDWAESYNAKGEVLENIHYNEKGYPFRVERFNYERDENGNWIKQVADGWYQGDDGKTHALAGILYRTIVYY